VFSPRYVGFIACDGRVCKNLGDIDDRGLDWRTRLFCYEVNREGEGVVKLGYERI